MKTFPELIRYWREHAGLSLSQAAAKAGMTKAHLWELEDGRARNPTIKTLAGLATAYNADLPYLAELAAAALSSEVQPVGSERSDEGNPVVAEPLDTSRHVDGAGWQTIDVLPDVGRKFIALYDDGSGAAMFWRHDDGFIDQNGDEFETVGKGYDRWAYLPDELEFWCETVAEDPVILTLPPAALAQPSPLDTAGRVEGGSARTNLGCDAASGTSASAAEVDGGGQ